MEYASCTIVPSAEDFRDLMNPANGRLA